MNPKYDFELLNICIKDLKDISVDRDGGDCIDESMEVVCIEEEEVTIDVLFIYSIYFFYN